MLDVLGVQANELQEVWYVLDDGDNCLTIKETLKLSVSILPVTASM